MLKVPNSIKLLVKMRNVFFLTEKTTWTFWPTQSLTSLRCVFTGCLTLDKLLSSFASVKRE